VDGGDLYTYYGHKSPEKLMKRRQRELAEDSELDGPSVARVAKVIGEGIRRHLCMMLKTYRMNIYYTLMYLNLSTY